MQALIWIGSAITLIGVGTLLWCIWSVFSARRSGLPDEQLRAKLQRIVAWNLGALLLSALGLMCVVTGILLS